MRYELYKIINKKIVIVIVFVALLINGINCMNIVKRSNKTDIYRQSERVKQVYDKVEGQITVEKVNYIFREYERLESIVRSGDYSKEYDKNTYTGYIEADYILFMELYKDIVYVSQYAQNSEKIVAKAQEGIDVFAYKNNEYMAEYNRKLTDLYEKRVITNYYGNTNGWKKYFNYQFSNLIVVMLIIFLNAALFAGEREEKMSVILLTSRKGRTRTFIDKITAGILVSLFVATIIYLEDFVIFYFGFGLKGAMNPIYSLPEWELCPLNVSIAEFALIIYCFRMIGVIILTVVVMLASGIADNSLWASVMSVSFIIVAVIINNLKLPCDFLYLMSSQINLMDCEIYRFFNIPVLKIEAVMVICIIAAIIMLLITYIFEAKWKLIQRRERV